MITDATLNEQQPAPQSLTRRDFVKTAAVAAATTVVAGCATVPRGEAGPTIFTGRRPERLRVGVIGCGGRGTGAAADCMRAAPNIEIVALGDVFPDRIAECLKTLTEDEHYVDVAEHVHVPEQQRFTGFDSYKGVLSCAVDLVILAAPPGFRPLHLKAAVEAGKHIFTEKPVAVDPVGVRAVIAASNLAAAKRLSIVAGTQRRHDPCYLETMKRIHGGAIGDIVAAQCYWNMGELWVKKREPEWTDMEWQCRNWLYFTWLSGDHIVEQHVHNLDVINWALKSTPVSCMGMGGRQVRTGEEFGNIFDHFAVEYLYPGGVRVLSMCRQTKGATDRVSERVVGTRGAATWAHGTGVIEGTSPWKHTWKYAPKGKPVNPYVQEHVDLIAGIRQGKPLNEGRRVAESTLSAIMGRMSAYTGRELSWDWAMNASQLDLTPPSYEMGDLPVAPVATPGVTELV